MLNSLFIANAVKKYDFLLELLEHVEFIRAKPDCFGRADRTEDQPQPAFFKKVVKVDQVPGIILELIPDLI